MSCVNALIRSDFLKAKAISRNSLNWYVQHYVTLMTIILIFIIFSILSPKFILSSNLLLILKEMSPLLLQALGLTFIFIVGEIDLSVGVITTAGAAFVMGFLTKGLPIYIALILTILIASIFGAFNGFLISFLRLPSTVTTLGAKLLFTGVVYSYTKAINIYKNIPISFTNFGQNNIFGFSYLTILGLAIFLILYFFMSRTKISYHLYAVGYDEKISTALGLKSKFLKFFAFVLGAVFAAIGGIMMVSQTGIYFPSAAGGVYLMDSIAAVFIGKTVLKDGQPHFFGTLCGVLLISIVKNGINVLGLSVVFQYIIIGLVFILSLVSEAIYRKKAIEE